MSQHAPNADDPVGQIQPHGFLLKLRAAIRRYRQMRVKFSQARKNKSAISINLSYILTSLRQITCCDNCLYFSIRNMDGSRSCPVSTETTCTPVSSRSCAKRMGDKSKAKKVKTLNFKYMAWSLAEIKVEVRFLFCQMQPR